MISVSMTLEGWQLVINLLAEQPYKASAQVIQVIAQAVNEHQQQQQNSNVEVLRKTTGD